MRLPAPASLSAAEPRGYCPAPQCLPPLAPVLRCGRFPLLSRPFLFLAPHTYRVFIPEAIRGKSHVFSQPYTVSIACAAALRESTSRLRLFDNSSVAPV